MSTCLCSSPHPFISFVTASEFYVPFVAHAMCYRYFHATLILFLIINVYSRMSNIGPPEANSNTDPTL